MIEAKPEIRDAVDALYGVASSLKRGEILTHEAIGETIGLQPYEGRWALIVARVRNRLESVDGIATWPVNGVGFELLTPARQLEIPRYRLKRAIKQVRKSKRSVSALPEKGLSFSQRRIREAILERLPDAERNLRAEFRVMAQLTKPSPTVARPQVPVNQVAARPRTNT